MSRIGIAGSLDYPHLDEVGRVVRTFDAGDVVVTGDATDVERVAVDAARARGLEVEVIRSKRLGRGRQRLVKANLDRLVVFWDVRDALHLSIVNLARLRNIPVEIRSLL